jgi:hypothetical protein
MTAWMHASRRACAAALAVVAVAWPLAAAAQDDAAVLERRVKGALLFRFTSYVEWPDAARARPDAPFVIAILGQDALAAELEAFVAGRTVEKRPIVVRRVRAADNLKDVQVLFVGRTESPQLERAARGAPQALIVTEWPGALEQGGVINFAVVDGQVRFEISLESARQRNLKFSSRLLSVAHGIKAAAP